MSELMDFCPWLTEAEGVEGIYWNITHPLQAAVTVMEHNGVYVDKERLIELGGIYTEKIAEQEGAWYEACGSRIRYTSVDDVREWFYEKCKLPVIHVTKKGKVPSTDKLTLQKLADYHPSVQALLDLRQSVKIKKDFLTGSEDGRSKGLLPFIQSDGRIHTTYRVDGTDSGRLSSASPNMQNIVKSKDPKLDIKSMFKPRPGHTWIEADFSQLELRVMAILSGDPKLLAALGPGGDLHRETAATIMYNKPVDQITDLQRDSAKQVNFGIPYGMGPPTLAFRLNTSIDKADGYIKGWFDRYREVDRMFKRARRFAVENGYRDNVLGRRRHLPQLQKDNQPRWDPAWPRKFHHLMRVVTNFDIQSTGSDFLSLATIALVLYPFDEFKATGAIPIMTLHDAIYFEVPDEEVDTAAYFIGETMSRIPKLLLGDEWVLPAEVMVGQFWGDKSNKMKFGGEEL